MTAANAGGKPANPAQMQRMSVTVMGDKLTFTDGTATEVIRGDLKDGEAVVVGLAGTGTSRATPSGRLRL